MPEDEQKEMSNEQNPQTLDGSSGKDDTGSETPKLKSSWELAMENKHPVKSEYQRPVTLEEKKEEKQEKPLEKEELPKPPTAEEIGKAVADALDKRGKGPEGGKEITWDKAVQFLLAAGAVIDEVQEFKEYADKHGERPTAVGWVRWKRNKEKEQKPPYDNQSDKEKSSIKEKSIEELPFDELIQRTIQEENNEKINRFKEEIHKRAGEAESKQYFDRQYLKNKILDTARESSWDTYYDNLIMLAQNVENEARGHLGYRDNPRYDGLVEMAVKLAARKTKDEGISRKIDRLKSEGRSQEEIDNYLVRKFGSPKGEERYENNKKVLDRIQIIDFTALNLAEIVGADERKKRDVAEEDKRRRQEQMPEEAPKSEIKTITMEEEIIAKGTARGMKEGRLSPEQEIEDFVAKERWSDNSYEFNKENNLYYRSIDGARERQVFEWRVWLHLAMARRQNPEKNYGAWGAEQYASNPEMKRIPQEALEELTSPKYFPGVNEVLHEYQILRDENKVPQEGVVEGGFQPPVKHYRGEGGEIKTEKRTLMDCVSREDIDIYRKMVEEKIFNKLQKKYAEEGIEKSDVDLHAEARNAEQIGWNIWVVQGGFDRESIWIGKKRSSKGSAMSLDHAGVEFPDDPQKRKEILDKLGFEEITDSSDERNYSEIIRIRGPKMSQSAVDMMHKPVRSFLNPMDALIDMATRGKKAEDKEQKVGALYDWASRNIRESLEKVGVIGQDGLDRFYSNKDRGFAKVVIIDDEDEKNYWRIENNNGKYTLFIPQFIPVRTMGSYFEHTMAYDPNDNFKEKKLVEFIRKGEPIPWRYTQGGFSSYLVDTSYWVGVWNTLDYDVAKKGGEDEDLVLDMLGAVNRREDKNFFRWIRHYHKGVVESEKLPRMITTLDARKNLKGLSEMFLKQGNTERAERYSDENMYFPWDRKAKFSEKFGVWKRETLGLN